MARQLVYRETGRTVETTIVVDCIVMRDRKPQTIDEAAFATRLREAMQGFRRDFAPVAATNQPAVAYLLEAKPLRYGCAVEDGAVRPVLACRCRCPKGRQWLGDSRAFPDASRRQPAYIAVGAQFQEARVGVAKGLIMSNGVVNQPIRMATGHDPSRIGRYDGLAITLHWLTALLVVMQFALAQIWSFLPRGGDTRHALQSLHISLGLTLAAVVLIRLVWRGGFSRRLPPADTGLIKWVARAVHYGLYALLVAMVLTGLGKAWGHADAAGFFGLFSVPALFVMDPSWRSVVNGVHLWAAWAIVGLAGLHAAAALFHHYALHDGVLRRMMPGDDRTAVR